MFYTINKGLCRDCAIAEEQDECREWRANHEVKTTTIATMDKALQKIYKE